MKPTYAVGFATGSPLPFPANWIGDQIRLWINAPAPKLKRVKYHFISDYSYVKTNFHINVALLVTAMIHAQQ